MSSWSRAKQGEPCPICDRTDDRCAISENGLYANCYKMGGDGAKQKIDKAGEPYWVHRIGGSTNDEERRARNREEFHRLRIRRPDVERADADTIHEVYTSLLTHGNLKLNRHDTEALSARGFKEGEAEARGYRSLPSQHRVSIAKRLENKYGEAKLLTVPGFIPKNGVLTIGGRSGLIFPVRDHQQRIVGLSIRPRERSEGGPKYLWFTSKRKDHDGPSPGTPIHVPLGVPSASPLLRITEGAIKADLATLLSGVPTIGLAGVGIRRGVIALLKEMGTETARIAFDADWKSNPKVARALYEMGTALAKGGIAVEVECWSMEHGKGIDDLLLGGGTPSLLIGDGVRAVLAEAAEIAGIVEAKEIDPAALLKAFQDLASASASGVGAIYTAKALLLDLALVKTRDAGAYAMILTGLEAIKGFKESRLNAALKEHLESLKGRAKSKAAGEAQGTAPWEVQPNYTVQAGKIGMEVANDNGILLFKPLADFDARITHEVRKDDGVTIIRQFKIAATMAYDGSRREADIPAAKFPELAWVSESFGALASISAGRGVKDHLRRAMEVLSRHDLQEMTVYTHVGWRKQRDGRMAYLHEGGAITSDGNDASVAVELENMQGRYRLPDPPKGEERIAVIRDVLKFRQFAEIGRPSSRQLAAVSIALPFRAAICRGTFSIQWSGTSGSWKTCCAALIQQFFGREMHEKGLPAAWSDTGPGLEAKLFAIKDAILTIDDWKPKGPKDLQILTAKADQVFRSQGNGAARSKMGPDGRPAPDKPPRGVVLSTGEDQVGIESATARTLPTRFVKENSSSKGTVNPAVLTELQALANSGRFALAMAAFLQWLAPRQEATAAGIPAKVAILRALAKRPGDHGRTPEIVAELTVGCETFLEFAREVGAISEDEARQVRKEVWDGLMEAADEARPPSEESDPAEMFLGLIHSALAGNQAFITNIHDASAPDNLEAACGWRKDYKWQGNDAGQLPFWVTSPNVPLIGWTDGTNVYLEPKQSYKVAMALSIQNHAPLGVCQKTIAKLLKDSGKIVPITKDENSEKRKRPRKFIGGRQIEVLAIACKVFWPDEDKAEDPARVVEVDVEVAA